VILLRHLTILFNEPSKHETCWNGIGARINVKSSYSQWGPAVTWIQTQILSVACPTLLTTDLYRYPSQLLVQYSTSELFSYPKSWSYSIAAWRPEWSLTEFTLAWRISVLSWWWGILVKAEFSWLYLSLCRGMVLRWFPVAFFSCTLMYSVKSFFVPIKCLE